jgi:hypothetical protein
MCFFVYKYDIHNNKLRQRKKAVSAILVKHDRTAVVNIGGGAIEAQRLEPHLDSRRSAAPAYEYCP